MFQRLLALLFLDAWISLGVQVHELISQRGLIPIAPYLAAARKAGAPGFWQFPTFLWINASDAVLTAGVWVGSILAVAALAGFFPRVCFAVSGFLYLSYATACRTFLWFQWDNMLLECGLLSLFLPTDRPARWGHLLFRLLVFKLYWESGIAKWQSYLHDWQDGSAMTFYYETAPLPTWLAWYAHNLPTWWHHIESRGALVLELGVPFLIFGPRLARLVAFGALSGFQVIDAVTANYGFFCYLSAALHVFILDDRDVDRVESLLKRIPRRVLPAIAARAPLTFGWERALQIRRFLAARTIQGARKIAVAILASVWIFISALEGVIAFADVPSLQSAIRPVREVWQPWRLVHTYHLFGHITRERIEPEFQTSDGETWTAHDFRHKPGDVHRPPDFVAPHQPRVDFSLWFYGLSFRGGAPDYVVALLDRMCHDPSAIEGLFGNKLPEKPRSVRLAFWQYHLTTPDERRATGDWWKRELLGTSRPIDCSGPF